jgi:hypothetical protein
LRHNRYQTVQVKTVRLDDDLQFTPDIVKLDLQGGEPAALRGLGERLRQVKIVKAEVHMLHGEARRECVRILKEAGFKMYIGDLQFSVPEVSSTLRSMMAEQDIRIEHELRGSAFDAQTMIIGKWSGEQPLPFQDLDFTPAFESLLRAEKTKYFSVDLIAINLKYAESWNVLLPSINL